MGKLGQTGGKVILFYLKCILMEMGQVAKQIPMNAAVCLWTSLTRAANE